LGGPLELWRSEIEKTGPLPVYLLHLEPGETAPLDAPHRATLAQFTDNPNFQQQFANAQALSVTVMGNEGRMSFVLVNKRQTPAEDEPYVIAHEFGHLWLKAKKYPAPAYSGGPAGCLSISAGDAVQHVLIRKEMDRRKVEWRRGWIRALEKALAALEAEENPAPPNRCQAVAQAALWVDVRLGLTDEQWPARSRFLKLLGKRFPVIQPAAEELAVRLAAGDLEDKPAHLQALGVTFTRLKEMALTLPN